jgi:RNA polymerase sigma factor (sigma-70 family)
VRDLAAEIEPYIPALRRYAWVLVRNQDAADDLVQDCLERAVSRWHLRRHDGEPRAWLFTILRNLYLNEVRRRGRSGTHVELQEAQGTLATDADGERTLIGRDALQAMNLLSEEHRSLLLLIGVDDFSYQEAAAVFGVPTGTIMSRLNRARAELRRLVESGAPRALRRVK